MSAQSRFLSNFVAIAAVMSASGCICVSGPAALNGDISFLWTFNGRTCMQSQDITTIVVEIPGQTLENNGRYNCVNGGTAGIRLLNFRPTTYSYTITAQNARGEAIFQARGSVRVDGDVVENVDLKPTGTASGTAYVAWTLPAGTSVTCQYLAAVDITIDNAQTVTTTASCAQGLYQPNVPSLQGVGLNLTPGTHTILIDARDSTNFYYYRKTGTITVNAAETTQQVFTLDWLVGTVPIRFTFSNGITQITCAQAGVTQVEVTLRDSANQDYVSTVPCQLNGIDGYTPYAYAGTYTVYASAVGTGGATFTNFGAGAPPLLQVTAQAGVFPPLQPNTPATLLSTP